MKKIINNLKHKPTTYAGAILILAAIYAFVSGMMDFDTFEGKIIEITALIFGGALVFGMGAPSDPSDPDPGETPLPDPKAPRPKK